MHYQLAYQSIQTYPPNPMQALRDIQQVSVMRNAALEISSMLLYHGGEFFQLLEGPKDAVRELFHKRVSNDHRHRSIAVLIEKDLRERTISGTRFGFDKNSIVGAVDEDMAKHADQTVEALLETRSCSAGQKMLRALFTCMLSR